MRQNLTNSAIVYLKTKGIDPKTHPVVAELVWLFLTLLSRAL